MPRGLQTGVDLPRRLRGTVMSPAIADLNGDDNRRLIDEKVSLVCLSATGKERQGRNEVWRQSLQYDTGGKAG